MLSRLQLAGVGLAIYAGIASLYLPDGGYCSGRGAAVPQRRAAPVRCGAAPLPLGDAVAATKCKSDSDCTAPQSCVDGVCCLPARKHSPSPTAPLRWPEPPHSALASWGDSLRMAR